MQELYYIINAFAGINVFGLFWLLFLRKRKSIPNKALVVVKLVLACYFINSVLMLLGIFPKFVNYSFFFVQFFAVFFPSAIYIYVISLLGRKVKKTDIVFIISSLIGLIPVILFIRHLGLTEEEQLGFFNRIVKGPYPLEVTCYSVIFYTFQQIVFIYLLYECNRIRGKLKKVLADLSTAKINYLWNFMIILVTGNTAIVVLYLIFDILFVEYLLLPGIVTVIYSYIVYNAFKNSAVLSKEEFQDYLNKSSQSQLQKIKAQVSKKEGELISKKIQKVLHQEKVYRDSELSLDKLSKLIDEPTYKVSYVINNYLNTTFYDVVNVERVEEAKALLQENQKYTIEGVGLEVGYKSRATFYRAFKKYTGKTPTVYISSANKC